MKQIYKSRAGGVYRVNQVRDLRVYRNSACTQVLGVPIVQNGRFDSIEMHPWPSAEEPTSYTHVIKGTFTVLPKTSGGTTPTPVSTTGYLVVGSYPTPIKFNSATAQVAFRSYDFATRALPSEYVNDDAVIAKTPFSVVLNPESSLVAGEEGVTPPPPSGFLGGIFQGIKNLPLIVKIGVPAAIILLIIISRKKKNA